MAEGRLLKAAMASEYLGYRRFQVIVDRQPGHPTPELKGVPLAQQEGVLPLGREAFDKHCP